MGGMEMLYRGRLLKFAKISQGRMGIPPPLLSNANAPKIFWDGQSAFFFQLLSFTYNFFLRHFGVLAPHLLEKLVRSDRDFFRTLLTLLVVGQGWGLL